MNFEDLATAVTDNSRAVVAVMLLLTVVVGAGVPMVERSTSLDQFQSDTVESDALDYADANFTSTHGNGTPTQVIVRGDVLERESLLSVLKYQETLRDNETVNESLSDDGLHSVANVLATAAVREDQADELRAREEALNETRDQLEAALVTLERNPNASVRAEFEAVDANTSVNLTESDYETFEASAETLRNRSNASRGEGPAAGNASAGGEATVGANATGGQAPTGPGSDSARAAAYRNGTVGVLEDEYDALAENWAELRDGVNPSLDEQRDALAERNQSEIDDLVARVLDEESASGRALSLMPDDYDPGSTEANATLLIARQETEDTSFAAGNAPDAVVDAELAMAALAEDADGDLSYLVFGSGVVAEETNDSMVDSLLLVGPLALLFVVVVLVFAYRDLLDILLGVAGVGTVLVWTFGVMGWLGIDFNQPFIIVVVLLIGLSIDYAIHLVMRYREALPDAGTPRDAMGTALASVGVALLLVTATTAIGFLSNLSSPLSIFRQIGVVSAIGIVATLLVFGVLVPALKVELDSGLEARGIDREKRAIGTGNGAVNRLLGVGATLASRAPVAVVVVALLVSAGGAYGATQVDTSFSESDFLAEDPADWLRDLPEPFAPGEYTAQQGMDVLNDRFVRQDSEATVLVEGDVTDPATLDKLAAAEDNASGMSVTEQYPDGDPAITSPLTVMEDVAAENESFARTLNASDTDGDGVPDRNVSGVYAELHRVAPERADGVVYRADDGDYEALKVVVAVDGGAEGGTVTEQMRWVAEDVEGDADDVTATATGQVVINAVTADQLLDTVVQGLAVALLVVLAFLSLVYRITAGSASLGAVTVLPVAFTVTWVLGSMALLDVPFNIVTGMITGLTIGLGVDYAIHVSERFDQELERTGSVDEALAESVTGTGGALFSSATTTASGFGVLVVALLPFLQAFGVITALTIVYAFVASVFVLPSLLALWARATGRADAAATTGEETPDAPSPSVPGEVTAHAGNGHETPESPSTADRVVATRTLSDRIVAPGEEFRATLAVHGAGDRALLRESVPGPYRVVEADPEPLEVVERDDRLYALWSDGGGERSLTYETHVPPDASDDAVEFDGAVATGDGDRPVDGESELAVVADLFQRVVERGAATDADVQAAAAQFDGDALTDEEFERLCRAWLDRPASGGERTARPDP